MPNPEAIAVRVNGRPLAVPAGTSVAAAVMLAGEACRRSVSGEARGPLCGMGVCFECRVTINGRPHRRACQIACEPGLEIATDG